MALTNYTIGAQYGSLTAPTVASQPPFSTATMDVDTGLTLHAVNRKLQIEATLDEVFVDLGADVVSGLNKPIQVPNAIYMRLQSPATGSRTSTVPFLLPFKGAPRQGNAEQQKGYERPFGLKFCKAYYNEYSYAVAGSEWGVDYNDVNVFDLYSYIQPGISKLMKEIQGKWIREATLRTISTPLTKAPVSLTAHWNKNWFLANLGFGSQPSFSSTEATFRAAIHTAFDSAATGTNAVNMNIDLDYLLALQHYASNIRKIRPIMIGEKASYVVLIPSSQFHLLLSNDEGQLGKVWENTTALSKEEQSYPGVVGRVGKLLIIEDQRYATLVDNGSGTFTVTYCMPGNEDSRNTSVWTASSNEAYDIGALYGEAALIDWVVKDLHFEIDKEEYGKVYGKGAFAERGIQLVEYTNDTDGDTDSVNYGSIVLAFSAPSIVVTA